MNFLNNGKKEGNETGGEIIKADDDAVVIKGPLKIN